MSIKIVKKNGTTIAYVLRSYYLSISQVERDNLNNLYNIELID